MFDAGVHSPPFTILSSAFRLVVLFHALMIHFIQAQIVTRYNILQLSRFGKPDSRVQTCKEHTLASKKRCASYVDVLVLVPIFTCHL